jgi:hypothetical protein
MLKVGGYADAVVDVANDVGETELEREKERKSGV